ncbi:hypothetical protein [Thermomonas sp. HDW16]|uniref:hypothetical protein n=1 Tax=Thermomonas sp. HDW16 TaxID=2714945 RepID=UPI00140C7089|nr:hypothetical protein [Thermomonas sp. HDW16]QIL19375.1 hypothetical protein G7079_00725 [Thermomonas sp. HDW16]
MTRDAVPLEHDAIAGFGDGIVRDARHADAIASLEGSPVPALLESVHALQAVLLSANPHALRARVGWIGRLIGRDLVLEAEGRAFRERLRVLMLDADGRLAAFARFDEAIAAHEQRMLASIEALDAAIVHLGTASATQSEATADAIERRRQHLLVMQQAWRITASQLALTRLNHRQLVQRIQPMLPLVQTLLDQQHATQAARDAGDTLQSASKALASANALLAGYSPLHPAAPEHAP